MSFRITLDQGKCQGYANCLIEAPAIWDFDEETDQAVLKVEHPTDDLLPAAEASARCCPAQAIQVQPDAS